MHIEVIISTQELILFSGKETIHYLISTAIKGVGQSKNSWKTPVGRHIIRAKIGAHAQLNSVFVGRRFTQEIYNEVLKKSYPNRTDWILTRILWLSGLELGVNRLGSVDTMQRYIYIHGSPDTTKMGMAGSKGCIRMHNNDIVDLFERVTVGTEVIIKKDK